MNPIRRIPLNYLAIAEESGLKRGKICHSAICGWCVQNIYGEPGPHMSAITAPALKPGESRLTVENGHWCFYE